MNKLAHGLLSLGIQKRGRIAVLLHNSNEYVEIFWAVAK
ncbi:AMP-binding protein [Oceanobacillus salinisoli]|nr:AMP-binding protein [Oceanobacillus salinisoli]